jgi:L-rhamnonate dehydratase
VLAETAAVGVYWIEEAFHEDGRLYERLKEWLAREGLETLIADREGAASPHLLDWARQGLIDVVQYDVLYSGFSRWLELGPQLDAWGVRSAPHHYGGWYGNYAACHLAARIEQFEFVEWDEATVPGLDASAYRISEGRVHVPHLPGFGVRLDEDAYTRAVEDNGFVVSKE